MLIDLINGYKNIYSRNVCMMVFMKIVCIMVFHTNCFYNGFSYELLVCDGFFMHIVSFRIIFSTKRGYVYV